LDEQEVIMKVVGAVLASLALAVVALLSPPPAAAEGRLGEPRVTSVGTVGGIAYTQYDGIFEGRTSTGAYRVPYRITAPTNPARGNRTVLVEPPHFVVGLGTLDLYLGRALLFSRGFAHAGIGWSTAKPDGGDRRILDPSVPGVFINGGVADGDGRTDDEIIADFARALAGARQMLGSVRQRYVAGFSDSSEPVLRLVTSGRAAGVFDFALPFTAEGHDPQAALAAGRYGGKLIVVNSEFDPPDGLVDRGGLPDRYRFYAVAGTGHIPDFLEVPFFSSRSSPASFAPALRAHFLQGHAWVGGGPRPPQSTHLKTGGDGTLARDGNGNAIAVDATGRPVPRLPFVELGEARFITGFLGSYDAVKTVAGLGFAGHDAYVRAFRDKLKDYAKAGYILKEDEDAMLRRAELCPPRTFTETYRDRYDAFVAIARCDR
jgi:hypothetical protein